MTLKQLIDTGYFKSIHLSNDLEQEISGPFCCDLLSAAMGSAPSGCVWVTIMGNVNTLAVASLVDAACIILAQDIQLDESALEKAKSQEITVLQSSKPIFETALDVYQLLHG